MTKIKLLLEIARCPSVEPRITEGRKRHQCLAVVSDQKRLFEDGLERFHVPEPWNGDIENAPILLVGTNPALTAGERFPTRTSSDDVIVDFFENRFFGDHTRDGVEGRLEDGS